MINLLLAGLCVMGLQVTPEEIIVEDRSPSMSYECEFSQEDYELMVRVVMSESGGQPMECKEAVATTILNRYHSPNHPNSIKSVVKAYSTHDNGAPNDDCYKAVTNAIAKWGTLDQEIPWCCYYFRGGHYHEWALNYRKIGDLYFSLPRDAVID